MSLVDSVPGANARASSTPKQVLAVWGAVAGLLALWGFRKGWVLAASLGAFFALLLAFSAMRPPRLLARMAGKAARFSDIAADHLSRIVLGLWYYVIFTPVALLWRVLRHRQPEDNGMWKDFRDHGACSFRRPF
jgi:hypothetical protein